MKWQQHYYTWSTNSLSGNRVGLGIVAASDSSRESLHLAGTECAKCNPCRDEENIMVERLFFSPESNRILRTGTVPYKQSADRRNNKFVHLFSAPWQEGAYPEDYLCPASYQKEWDGQKELEEVTSKEIKKGRDEAVRLVKKYHLENQLADLFYDVYHCIFTAERPLVLRDSQRKVQDFAEFSREMMILIHYMLPEFLRKEADYVSYVSEMTQEAHFLFTNKFIGKYSFSMNQGKKEKEYTLLEKEFFEQLSEAFLLENDGFEQMIYQMEQILVNISDKRNRLEKCILASMASYAGKQKEKEDFFISMERLMYWARKDKSLLKTLENCVKDLDFQNMTEEELLSHTKMMITGAGGETKDFVLNQLNEMLMFYFEKEEDIFYQLLTFVRENHGKLYVDLLLLNKRPDGFTKEVLYLPVKDLDSLETAVKYHHTFLEDSKYRTFLVKSAYALYCKERQSDKRNRIEILGKKADEDTFVLLKKKTVEGIVDQASDLDTFLSIFQKMDLNSLEPVIHSYLYRKAVFYLKKETKISVDHEQKLCQLGEKIQMTKEMETEILSSYKKQLQSDINKMDGKALIDSALSAIRSDSFSVSDTKSQSRSRFYRKAWTELVGKRYLVLIKEDKKAFYQIETENWILFVLKVTGALDKDNRQLVNNMIQETKKAITASNCLSMLACANHTLKNYGTATIHCPESMWQANPIHTMDDFKLLYEEIEDLSLIRCEKSEEYHKVLWLYEYADKKRGTLEEKTEYAWKRYEKKKDGDGKMEETGWRKAVYYALEDILSKSIWAFLLGFYGFLFVSIREEVAIMPGYIPSVAILILLVLIYAVMTLKGYKEEQTPGSFLYIMGVGILFMNWGLALDTFPGVITLYVTSLIISIAAKILHYILFIRQKDETEDED